MYIECLSPLWAFHCFSCYLMLQLRSMHKAESWAVSYREKSFLNDMITSFRELILSEQMFQSVYACALIATGRSCGVITQLWFDFPQQHAVSEQDVSVHYLKGTFIREMQKTFVLLKILWIWILQRERWSVVHFFPKEIKNIAGL